MTALSPVERLARARAAQQFWASLPVSARIHVLAQLRRAIAANRERIVDAIVSDTGKPRLDALAGDILVTLEQMLFYERRAAQILRSRSLSRSKFLYPGAAFHQQFEPHGVALIYGPANYPFQLAMVPAITALFAGNAVLLKVSERAPEVARMILELAQVSDLPSDLLQVTCDGPQQSGEYIDAHPDIIFFTGSTANGLNVAARAAARLIPLILELGGKDPAIVFADCNLERTIEGVTYGGFSNAGQVCLGIKRLYVEKSIFDPFIDRLAQRINHLRVGSGTDCDMGILQGDNARQLFASQVREALERGATLRSATCTTFFGDCPVLLTNVPSNARLLMEETFGPVVCASSFSNEADAVALANQSSFSLGASVWTADIRRAHRVAAAINSGSCAINDVIRNIGNPSASFGGNSKSGFGRYRGAEGLLAFTRSKTVMTVPAWRAREINWFPFTPKTYQGLQFLLEIRHRSVNLLTALRRCAHIALLLITAGAAKSQTTPGDGHLRLTVEIPSGVHGSIGYLVFKASDGFPQDRKKAIAHGFMDGGSARVAHIDVGGIPPGRYAVSAYLDENGNHKLDTGWLGIPKEPVGASNNPRPRRGPPRFEDCAFQMGASNQTVSIRLEMPQ